MRILLIESDFARRLPFIERMLKKKLEEAHIADVEVESAVIPGTVLPATALSHSPISGNETETSAPQPDKRLNRKLLNSADLILVMAKEQRDLLTKFIDYNRWNHLHLFQAYCFGRNEDMREPEDDRENDLLYRQLRDAIEDGCKKIAQRLAAALKAPAANGPHLALD